MQLLRMQTATLPEPVLDRRAAVPALLGDVSDFLAVAGLAGAAQELGVITDNSPRVFGLAGAMGAALPMALGLALAQPKRRVLCLTGDAELLMTLGALATVAVINPPNLRIVCVDNGRFGETGNQQSHTGLGTRIDTMAAGAGIAAVLAVNTDDDIPAGRALLHGAEGLCFILLRVKEGPPLKARRNLRPHVDRDRFRAALAADGVARPDGAV